MARIIGGIGTSHIPAIGLAMACKQHEVEAVFHLVDTVLDGDTGHAVHSLKWLKAFGIFR